MAAPPAFPPAWAAGGANVYHVKDLLGHESLNTLKHYAKLTIADLKKTHEKCHPRERDVDE